MDDVRAPDLDSNVVFVTSVHIIPSQGVAKVISTANAIVSSPKKRASGYFSRNSFFSSS